MNRSMKFYLIVFIIFQSLSEADILDINTYEYRSKNDYFKSDLKDELSKHHVNISILQNKLKNFQERFNSVETAKINKHEFFQNNNNQPAYASSSENFSQEPVQLKKETKSDKKPVFLSDRIGFYILPFVALQNSGDFEFKPQPNSPVIFDIDHELGFASGWRLGVESNHLFIDAEFSYFRNSCIGIEVLNTTTRFKVEGEAEGFGFFINGGGKIKVSSKTNFFLGGGFGSVKQEIGFTELSTSFSPEEESTLFTYQFFTGINYDMAEYLRIGLRYRWMRVGEMKLFTARELHLAELSFGCVF